MFLKKGMFSSLLILTICVVTNIGQVRALSNENYYGINISDEERINLLSLGFTEDDIYFMDEDTYLHNRNIHGEVVATTDRYFKSEMIGMTGTSRVTEITKEEYENPTQRLLRGTTETTYKKLTSSIVAQDNHKYRFNATLLWKQMPAVRSYDIMGIGFFNNIRINGGVSFNYRYYVNSYGPFNNSGAYVYKTTTYGTGKTFYFPEGATSLTVTMGFEVAPVEGKDVSELTMCADYAHATKNIPYSDISDYTMTYNGIGLGYALIDKYDEIPCAGTTITGATW